MTKALYHPYAITRLLIVVTLLMSATFAADAERVDYQRAAKIAQKYITLRNNKSIKAQAEQQGHGTGNVPYYIFNDAHGHGFVIVAGNDAMGEILAYDTENTLDTLNANPCEK